MARRGGGKRRGGGRYKRDRRGRFAKVNAAASGAGYSRTRRLDRRGRTYTKAYSTGIGPKQVGARNYVTVNSKGRMRQGATVYQLKGRRLSPLAPKDTRVTRSTVARRRGPRPGVPVGGNKNVRYLSRTHAGTRAVTRPLVVERGLGRAHSRAVVARANRTGRAPRTGYIVAYG